MSTTPLPSPTNKSNLVWWVLGFLGVAVVLLIVAALLVAGFFVKGVRVQKSGEQVDVRMPAGQLTVSDVRASDVGLPIYPGATPVESGGSVEFTTPEDNRVGVTAVRYGVSDSLEKVDAWSLAHLGSDFTRQGPGAKPSKLRVRGVTVGSADIAYVVDGGDLVRVVALKKKGTGVEIALARIAKQEAQ